jgi:D-glycero-D-manno-heptose 1,7-bisphosphate phosphatase
MKPTLFLDRDGVINTRLPGDYVRGTAAFVPLQGAIEAIALLNLHFGRVFVVTNQAGIGKGLMSAFDLRLVHIHLRELVEKAGGRVDDIFFCPHKSDEGCFCRKPATGMGWQALAAFPEIDFGNAWMVGDSSSDILFGKNLGMQTVMIDGKTEEEAAALALKPDFRFKSLWDFAQYYAQGME